MPTRLDQPVGGFLDDLPDALDKLIAGKARRQGIEKFNHYGARVSHKGAARPEKTGIERHWDAGHIAIRVDLAHAMFVAGWRVDWPARSFMKDDELTPA